MTTSGGLAAGTSTVVGGSRSDTRSGGLSAGSSTVTGASRSTARSGGLSAGSSTAVGGVRVIARSGGLASGRSFVVGGTPSLEPARPDPILLPVVPNWVTMVKKVFTFKTEIFTSRSGKEQRRALRTTPRKTVSFAALLNGDLLRSFERLLVRSHDKPQGLADVVRGVRSASPMASGASSITVQYVPAWLTINKLVVLNHRRRTRMLSVLAIEDLTVTFSGTTDIDWPASTRISPVLEGQLSTSVRSTRVTDGVAQIPIDFEATPAIETLDDGEVDYSAWMNGREILLLKPNWTRSPQITYVHEIETVDYGRGRIANFAPIDFGTRLSQATYLQRSAADVDALVQFFCRMKGMRGEFMLPTWADDLPLKEDIESGSNVITMTGTEVYLTYLEDTVHRSLLIVLNNGWLIPRAVIDVDPALGNSVLTLDQPMPYGIALSQINKVCWMPVTRFASDSLTVEYVTDEVGQVVISTMSLPAEDAEGDAPTMDEIADYLLSVYGWSMLDALLCDPLEHAVNVRYPQIAPV